MKNYITGINLRKAFEQNLSKIYATEVPMYSQMLPIVEKMNSEARKAQGIKTNSKLVQEHHGAIRVGTNEELHNMSRLFKVMDMQPVNYYDLSVAGLPVHSTAFRDTTQEGLKENGFRVFCSVLRHDLLPKEVLPEIQQTLAKRKIISEGAMEMIKAHEAQGELTQEQAKIFIHESAKTFQRNKKAMVTKPFYEKLLATNSLLADVVCFANPHINHLTPRTDDIDALFDKFHEMGIKTTPIIQGPPKRNIPILLRQMAFQAVMEDFEFPDGKGGFEKGGHRARFGEYETKEDATVTPKGRDLYDKLLNQTLAKVSDKDPNYTQVLNEEFKAFPDTKEALRKQELVYFKYSVNKDALETSAGKQRPKDFEDAIKKQLISYEPVPYHDFLPVSAAGIFKSNLVEGGFIDSEKAPNKQPELEEALGRPVIDSYELYASVEKTSIKEVEKELGISKSLQRS